MLWLRRLFSHTVALYLIFTLFEGGGGGGGIVAEHGSAALGTRTRV